MIIHGISDLHRQHLTLTRYLTGGDLLLIGGDYDCKIEEELFNFLRWCIKVAKNYTLGVVMTCGNHDALFAEYEDDIREFIKDTKVQLLLNQELTLSNGFTIFGSPNSESLGQIHENAYVGKVQELDQVYKNIPAGLDLLLTHTPPKGVMDNYCGSIALENQIAKKNPRLHMFGHAHESHGYLQLEKYPNTHFFNMNVVGTVNQGPWMPVVVEYDMNTRTLVSYTILEIDVT